MKFTDRQLKGFINRFFKKNDQLPTQAIIAKQFGVALNAANERMKKLEREKYLSRNEVNKYMFYRSDEN